jgi:hypothetical protein
MAKCRTIAQALQNHQRVGDIKGALTVQVLYEYLQIWDAVNGIVLQQDIPDHYNWKLTKSGIYSSKSAYAAFFEGSIKIGSWRRIWKSWAPLRCKFFIWLVLHNKCWTADRLAKRYLPHPETCPFCDQDAETIHHLLVGCVFSRQIWAHVLQQLGLIHLAPETAGSRFFGWWRRSSLAVPKEARKGLNSLIILVAWEIWKHRNACVFDHVRPNTQEVLRAVDIEGSLWCMAGASNL